MEVLLSHAAASNVQWPQLIPKAKAALRENLTAKKDFVKIAAHEVRLFQFFVLSMLASVLSTNLLSTTFCECNFIYN